MGDILAFFADVIKNNDVKLFMIYLKFIHGNDNVCQFSCKNNHFPRIMAVAIMTKTFYNLCIFWCAILEKLYMLIKIRQLY